MLLRLAILIALLGAGPLRASDLAMPAEMGLGEVPAAAPATVPRGFGPNGGLVFRLRGGIAATPGYFGDDDLDLGPDLGFRVGRVSVGSLNFGDDGRPRSGFGLLGSFRYIGERSSDEFDELEGLEDVDAALEIGGGIGYRGPGFEGFATVRYGALGHNTFVAELGADARFAATDRLRFTAGPRLLLGTDSYADTYFGVTSDEAAASSFDAYDPDGGLMTAGIEVGMEYALGDQWWVEGAVTYDRFVGDAEDSPIVEQGDRDQYGIRIGLTRQITLGF